MDAIWNEFHSDSVLLALNLLVLLCVSFLVWAKQRRGQTDSSEARQEARLRATAVALLFSIAEAIEILASSDLTPVNCALRLVLVVAMTVGAYQMSLHHRRSLGSSAGAEGRAGHTRIGH